MGIGAKTIAVGSGLLTIGLSACAQPPPAIYLPPNPIELVPTETPGVTFVIIRPALDFQEPPPADPARLLREYILLCDARPGDGMHCEVPPEAALRRISEYPVPPPAAALEVGVAPCPDCNRGLEKADKKAEPKPEPKR